MLYCNININKKGNPVRYIRYTVCKWPKIMYTVSVNSILGESEDTVNISYTMTLLSDTDV